MDIVQTCVDTGHFAYIVTSRADRSVAVWKLTSVGEFSNVFTISTPDHSVIPKTVLFNSRRDVVVFAFTGGEV
jgi:hypothetical protein